MVTTGRTGTKRNHSRSQKFKKAVLGRPQGIIQKRVQAVGPEKFGIVALMFSTPAPFNVFCDVFLTPI